MLEKFVSTICVPVMAMLPKTSPRLPSMLIHRIDAHVLAAVDPGDEKIAAHRDDRDDPDAEQRDSQDQAQVVDADPVPDDDIGRNAEDDQECEAHPLHDCAQDGKVFEHGQAVGPVVDALFILEQPGCLSEVLFCLHASPPPGASCSPH